jgi:hypothetical protein
VQHDYTPIAAADIASIPLSQVLFKVAQLDFVGFSHLRQAAARILVEK